MTPTITIRVPVCSNLAEFMEKANAELAKLTPEQIQQVAEHGVMVEIWSA